VAIKALSRGIKFRAWNDYTERLYKWEDLENAGSTNYIHEYFSNLKENGYHLMQYTGLHDKNGKEIYEGDIVKSQWQHNGVDCYDYELIGEIVFDSYYSSFRIENKDFNMPLCSIERETLCNEDNDGFEVIGNIYENTELIN
jgi:uncharacterized phage protein (TIGR01671 family)